MRFTIRELLLATLIVGLILGWGLDRWRLSDEIIKHQDAEDTLRWQVEAITESAQECGATVSIDGRKLTFEWAAADGSAGFHSTHSY